MFDYGKAHAGRQDAKGGSKARLGKTRFTPTCDTEQKNPLEARS